MRVDLFGRRFSLYVLQPFLSSLGLVRRCNGRHHREQHQFVCVLLQPVFTSPGRFCGVWHLTTWESTPVATLMNVFCFLNDIGDGSRLTQRTDACAGWNAHHEIPADREQTDPLFGVMADQNILVLKEILEWPYPSGSAAGFIMVNLMDKQSAADKENFNKAQHAYDVCLNQTTQAGLGFEPLATFLNSILESLSSESLSPATIGETLAAFEGLGIETFLSFYIMPNPTDPQAYILSVSTPSFAELPVGSDDETLQRYSALGANLLAAAHPGNLSLEAITELFANITELQMQLLNLTAAKETAPQTVNGAEDDIGVNDSPEASLTLGDLAASAPQLNLQQIAENLAPAGYNPDEARVNVDDVQSIQTYFASASALVENVPAELFRVFTFGAILQLFTLMSSRM